MDICDTFALIFLHFWVAKESLLFTSLLTPESTLNYTFNFPLRTVINLMQHFSTQ